MELLTRKKISTVIIVLLAWYWQKHVYRGPVYSNAKDLTGKTVLITGGNAGLGKATATEFARLGARVIIASRNITKSNRVKKEILEETKNDNVVTYNLDLEDFDSVRSFASNLIKNEDHLDILVNNAGVLAIRGKTPDGINRVHAINYFGHFLLTNLLLQNLKAQSKTRPVRIVIVTSKGYSWRKTVDFDRFTSDSETFRQDYRFYANTLFANILFASELHRKFKDFNITTYSIDPGLIYSEIGDHLALWKRILRLPSNVVRRPTYYGAQTILYCSLDDEVIKYSGDFFVDCARKELTEYAKDEELASKLWEESVKITKL